MSMHRSFLVLSVLAALGVVGCRDRRRSAAKLDSRAPAPAETVAPAKPQAPAPPAPAPPVRPARIPRDGRVKLKDLGAKQESVAPYLEGTLKADRRHGPWTSWYAPGHKAAEVSYVDGVRSGPFTLYWSDGQVAARGNYRGGKASKVVHEDGGSWNAILPVGLFLERPIHALAGLCDKLVVVTTDRQIRAYALSGLQPLWQHELPELPANPPVSRARNGKCVVAAETSKGLVLLDGQDGKPMPPSTDETPLSEGWQVVLAPGTGTGTLKPDDLTLVELASDGKGFTVQDSRGTVSGPWLLPKDLVCPGRLTVVARQAFACPGQSVIRVLTPGSGPFTELTNARAVRWTYQAGEHGAPELEAEEIGAVFDEGLVYVLHRENHPSADCTFDLYGGARLACYDSTALPPAFAKGVLYRWSSDAVEARDALSGEVLWTRPAIDGSSSDWVPVQLSKDGRAVSMITIRGDVVRIAYLDAATGEVLKSSSVEAGDMGRTEQAYFQVDGPMVAFLNGDEGVTIVDTSAMETRCTLPGPISSYLLRDGRAFLLKQRSVLASSTKNCKTLWRYRTGDFVVLSMEFAGEVLHLSGMQTGNGEPLEWWEEVELSSGQQIERSRRTPATYTPPPWRRSAWAPSGDVVGLRGEILQGLDTRRSTAHAVAADPLPRNPSAVDGGAAAEPSAK